MATPMQELSIIVPVYNEERTLASIMSALGAKCPEAQIVYVDDGSRDRSLAILQGGARPQDLVLTKENGGKGSAIRLGLEQASGQFTVIQDADLEYDPAEIRLLLDAAKSQPGSAVFGSRFLRHNPNIYKRFLFGNKALTFILNTLYGSRLTDSYTCYKLLPTDLFRGLDLKARGFELEAEICAKCLLKKIAIHEVPVSYKPRTIEEGKKINWRDAVKGVAMMVRLRLKGS
jgi:glycosyltransferase involved in cell wall biosynthesis